MSLMLRAFHQSFPLAQVFRISRGAKTSAEVVVVIVTDGQYFGWGESVPYARYGESIDSVLAQLNGIAEQIATVNEPQQLLTLLPAGSARNALDCALWDLRAKQTGQSVNAMLNLPEVSQCFTAQTLSIDTKDNMAKEALKLASAPLVKIKLDADDVVNKMAAIAKSCPNSRFIIDANEGWDAQVLRTALPDLAALNVALIEQPLPADNDDDLLEINSPIPLCADESCHTAETLNSLLGKYQSINIKLDKTGGLTAASTLLKAAIHHDLTVMVGCMVGSSLAMAPAFALCGAAQFVDLDGPLLVAQDRPNGFEFTHGAMRESEHMLWGHPELTTQPTLAQLWDNH